MFKDYVIFLNRIKKKYKFKYFNENTIFFSH